MKWTHARRSTLVCEFCCPIARGAWVLLGARRSRVRYGRTFVVCRPCAAERYGMHVDESTVPTRDGKALAVGPEE